MSVDQHSDERLPAEGSSDPFWSRRLRFMSRLFAGLATAFGVLTLAGWIVDSAALKSLAPNGITVKTNTSIALTLLGLALLLLEPERRGGFRTALGRLAAGLAGAIGLATLTQHLFGWNLGIDELLFREAPGAPGTSSPNRMGPPASTYFPLLAGSLLLIDRRPGRGASPSQLLALAVGSLAFLPILGYVFGVQELFGVAQLTGISLHTAIVFVLLATGILLARPDLGPMRLMTVNDSGGVLVRRMLPVAILLPVALGWLRIKGEEAGYYDAEFGRSLLIFSFILLFSGWTVRTGQQLSRQTAARARAEAAQLELKDRLVRILENISQGFCALDPAGRCTYVNCEAERLTGRTRQQALGHTLDELYPERRFPELHAGIRRASRLNQMVHVETRDDQSGAWLDHDVVPTSEGITLFTRDVTDVKLRDEERRRLLESEREARSVAEHSNRMKDEFLATLSHELRTPLNAILGWSMLLARSGLSAEETRRGLDAIERNSRLQARLIEDLLDMSRIVSGHVRLDLQEVDLAVLVDSVLLAMAPNAQARQIEVTRVVESGAPAVRGDPARLQQVLWNLMSNALKFTPRGGHVRVELRRTGGDVELVVEDDGTGIAPEFMPHIFDRFRQADASTTRRHGGLGLGLAIARHLTELHGGKLLAHSDGVDRGATFTVRLPVDAVPHHEPGRNPGGALDGSRSEVAGEPSSLAGVRVLVVEDQKDTRDLIEHLLRGRHAEVRVAESHDGALELLGRERFDVLISDIGMPGRDGYSLMRHVRERWNGLPGIALTAFAREEDRQLAMEAGFRLHLPKPVHPERLASAVAKLARENAAGSPGADGAPPAAGGATVDSPGVDS